MAKCKHCGQELPKGHLVGQDEHQRIMVLFTLRHKVQELAEECQGLIQIIDSLIPPDDSRPLSTEQMRKEIREA